MGNPCRYFFDNKFIIRRPEIDEQEKQVRISISENHLEDYYETALIDLYSAPDLIMTYSNGNTSKDEFRRYGRWEFKNLNRLHLQEYMMDFEMIYAFDEMTWNNCQNIQETDIPLGKFYRMTQKEVDNYTRKNFVKFKDWKPRPGEEAIEAALQALPENSLDRAAVKELLIAAYRVDL